MLLLFVLRGFYSFFLKRFKKKENVEKFGTYTWSTVSSMQFSKTSRGWIKNPYNKTQVFPTDNGGRYYANIFKLRFRVVTSCVWTWQRALLNLEIWAEGPNLRLNQKFSIFKEFHKTNILVTWYNFFGYLWNYSNVNDWIDPLSHALRSSKTLTRRISLP